MRLQIRITRSSVFGGDSLNWVISQVTQSLLDDGEVEAGQERRLEYLHALCSAAAYNMSSRKISELLKSDHAAETNFFDSSKHVLAASAAVGSMHMLKTLLSKGADPNFKSEYFGFALQNAARIGREDMVSLLLEYDTKVHSSASPVEAAAAALEAACQAGQERVIQRTLISRHKIGFLPAHYEAAVVAAARNGHVNLLRLLLDRGTFPKKEDIMMQSLLKASARGYLPVVRMLLESGINVNAINHMGQNALQQAALGGHARVVRLLLDYHAKYYAGLWGDPLYLAGKNGHEDVVQMLLEYGAPINGEGSDYCSVLTHAARNGESRMIRFLLEKGVDLQAFHLGDTALELAAEQGHEDTVRLLVGLGVNINGREDRDGPMLRAMMYGHDHIVKTLLELGAEEVDPLKSCQAVYFEAGECPIRWRP